MNIIITGGAGFLGSELLNNLLQQFPQIETIKVVDRIKLDSNLITNNKVHSIVADITVKEDIEKIIDEQTTHVFHLAAIVSSHAEEDFELGMLVNLKATQILLECCRQANPNIRLVFSSSLAVFGGELPEQIDYMTAMQPSSSYGTQKAICELLVNDYARKGFVDAVTVRLPTICIRPGVPNKAASSFVSGMIREPLKQQASNCPVDVELPLWVSSPNSVIKNIIHASQLDTKLLKGFRTVNLPGLKTSPKEMIECLVKIKGEPVLELISYEKDENVERIVSSWPQSMNNEKELAIGFVKDKDFNSILNAYLDTQK
ncbi:MULTISPECIES: D-erythronate dehydrogenase [unclassified Pseudoalteromonas]|uniref:D-erythronate dehydrogenase n=1 Tax=unclassified Pseudoalteromonas TaxID=194690 RepID=UPI0015F8F756|nr:MULTISPECIES: D-erythronate dehydrogenase [unclassified Pseudoalteromonas]MBB1407416.1 SDR family oxidoreductase [Pseudoalteromonas sp. SG44-5]MBH0070412.1 SDR family oxidoreductase [Pseudoalteromonas sp. NZS127]MBH0094736.1 SDR family oxidoreductase [Pseudoalteromonas sp. SCQQ13]|tara:strand:+ start:2076 stop:3023 length:948 start_codon:yes stop_codon:yes gene_type:complete